LKSFARTQSRRSVVSALAGLICHSKFGRSDAAAKTGGTLTQEKIARACEELDFEYLTELTVKLAAINSPLGRERPVAELLCNEMDICGLMAKLQPISRDRSNAVGTLPGSGGGRSLILNGHLETSGSQTPTPFPTPRIVDGTSITGRGVWNMKGVLAAYVCALRAIRAAQIELAGNVVIAGVAGAWDEVDIQTTFSVRGVQGYGIGTEYLLSHGTTADFAIVGEPTSFRIVSEHVGMTWLRVIIQESRSARVAITDLIEFQAEPGHSVSEVFGADDVIEVAGEIADTLRRWIPMYKHRYAARGITLFAEVSGIESEPPWSASLHRRCAVHFRFSTPPGLQANDAIGDIEELLTDVRTKHLKLEISTDVYYSVVGPSVSKDNYLVKQLARAHKDFLSGPPTFAIAPWYTDAAQLNKYGIHAINYGPPGRYTASSETVEISDLIKCCKVYLDLIIRTCSGEE